MDVREKLVELQEECDKICDKTDCDECKYGLAKDCGKYLRADYFVAHGVTIPVRCKDCKFSFDEDEDGTVWCTKWEWYTKCNDFCYLGERREDG